MTLSAAWIMWHWKLMKDASVIMWPNWQYFSDIRVNYVRRSMEILRIFEQKA